MHNPNDPEVLAVIPLPSRGTSPKLLPQERREVMLTRVMLVAIDHVLSGAGLGLDTARDVARELRHTFPELAAEWNEI